MVFAHPREPFRSAGTIRNDPDTVLTGTKRQKITSRHGYTDTFGTVHYDKALSERRAEAVEAESMKDDVARGVIVVQSLGKTHLLVATADGVREPRNRRVEITPH